MSVDVDDDNEEWRENHIKTFAGRGILLIRNPYRAMLSAWNHRTMTHTGLMDPLEFQSSTFRKFIFVCINRYRLTDTSITNIYFKLGGNDEGLVDQV